MKMKKGLIALLLTLPIALTSCLDSSDSEPDPMGPGISIYNAASVKNQLAMLPTDVGIRLAMLLDEADKRGLTENRLDVKIEGSEVLLRDKLFPNGTVIAQEGTKYTLEFHKGDNNNYYEGTVEVETGGTSWSDDSFEWTITTSGLKADVNNGLNSVTYTYSDEGTTVLSNGLGLDITLSDIWLKSSDNNLLEGWSGDYSLLTGASSWAYSDCHGKEFKMNGEGRDSALSWKVSNVNYKGAENTLTGKLVSVILSGTVDCRLVGSYNTEYYPSPNVKIVFSNNGQSYTITYNGQISQR